MSLYFGQQERSLLDRSRRPMRAGLGFGSSVRNGKPFRTAPQAQDNYHYETLINRLQVLYDTRFAQI